MMMQPHSDFTSVRTTLARFQLRVACECQRSFVRMASRSLALVLLLAVAAAGPAAAARLFDRRQCPPEGFDVQQDFVLEQFIDGRWFVQKQVREGGPPTSEPTLGIGG